MLPSAPRTDSDTTADGLNTLRNGLRLADRFALFVAVVNRRADRDTLIHELTSSFPDLAFRTVRLSETTADILDDVLQQAGDPPPGPVMVIDFDAAIASDASGHPLLYALNLRRPAWPRLVPHPVIFWVPEYVFTLLAHEAPDFLDWRSLTVFFPDTTARDLIPLRSDVWAGGTNTNFTRADRLSRITELEARLAQFDSKQTDRRMLSVRFDWLHELALHHLHLGNAHQALATFSEALELARELGDRRREGAALVSLGLAWTDLGDARKAIGFNEQALAVSREIGDRRGEGNALGNLGVAWQNLGDTRKAIGFYEQYLAIAREIRDRRGEGNALGNLGVAWADLGDARKAIGFHEQHRTVARELGDRRGEGATLGNLGIAWKNLGDARKAIGFYEQYLTVAREIGDRRGEASASFNMALALHGLEQPDEAIRLAEAALAIFTAIESPHAETVRRTLAEWRGEAAT